MAKDYTKKQKLATVEAKEKYCELLENCIKSAALVSFKCAGYESDKLSLEIFRHEQDLRIAKEIAEDFRNNYEMIFLPEYEGRLEDCHKHFDEVYSFMKANIKEVDSMSGLYASIMGYPTENPNNEDEEKMLLFYEAIKKPVALLQGKKTMKVSR